jgi:cytochrome P450
LQVLRPTSFKNINLPKGTTVAFSPYSLHRDESVYKDASKFNPHRFTKPALEELNSNRQYVPFGAGRHACQGQRFVTIILRLIWTSLFRDYETSIKNRGLPEPEYFGAMGTPLPKATVVMQIAKRTST